MKILTPGHVYELSDLDGDGVQVLRFVQRVGPAYPGNARAEAGTTIQEVLRCLIERLHYVDGQVPCLETDIATGLIESALALLEIRAQRVRGETLRVPSVAAVLDAPVCALCGHVKCTYHAGCDR